MDTVVKQTHTIDIATPTARQRVRVEVTVDVTALARHLGPDALKSKLGRASLAYGAIQAVVVDRG